MPRFYRKVIKISAEMSPNVIWARSQLAVGRVPDNRVVVPGVLTWADYQKRRATWDSVRQCIGLDGDFYEGAEVLLYPPSWINRAEQVAADLRSTKPNRKAEAIGIDPAEGGDKTAMAAVDKLGLLELVSRKTPDTSIITGEALAFMRKHGVPPEKLVFDRGGGGKEHADRLRAMGYPVRTVAFGESLVLDPKRGLRQIPERLDNREDQYAYKNRRAEMYGALRLLLDPSLSAQGFGLPADYPELRQQMAPIPLTYDPEGRLELLPKNKRPSETEKKCLIDLIGHSPDELDALVLAIHGMQTKALRQVAGVF